MDLLNVLGVNSTFYIQLLNFVLLVIVLKFILYKPLLKTIEDRKSNAKRIDSLKKELGTKLNGIDALRDKKINEAEQKASELIKEGERNAQLASKEILKQAELEKKKMLLVHEEELKHKTDEYMGTLQDKVTDMTLSVLQDIVTNDSKLQKKLADKIIETVNG